jgi:hypothetical protein
MSTSESRPEELAPGVYRVKTGWGISQTNVYLDEPMSRYIGASAKDQRFVEFGGLLRKL